MENIQINTTQNVQLNYTPAGLGQRLLSVILDIIFKTSYIILLYSIVFWTYFRNYTYKRYSETESNTEVMIGVFILLGLPALFYHLLCETFLNGQSFGKKIVKIKVVKLDGTQPNFGSYLIRSIFRIIDDGLIGIIAIAASQKSQRLGDMVAGTTVIQIAANVKLKDTILNQQRPEHIVVYEQVALLSDDDANTIKEVLDFALANQRPEHIRLLAKKIKSKYAIVAGDQNDEDFLKTLLLDFNHYQFKG